MASFTLDGITYEYLRPDPGHNPEAEHSWTCGQFPKVMATLPLADGTVDVHAVAERWNPSFILVSRQDDEWHAHWAWIPAGHVRRVTDSERERRVLAMPGEAARIRWGSRLPGFLPEESSRLSRSLKVQGNL